MRVRRAIFFGRLIAAGGVAALILATGPAAEAAMVGGYLLDGVAGSANPATVAEQLGNATQDLAIGSCATYNADTPFAYAGNTSLDTSCGSQARAAEGVPSTITAYDFQNTQDFSAKAWIKYTEDGSFRQIVSNRQNNSGNGWYLGVDSGEHATMFVQGTTVNQGRGVSGTSVLNDGQWHSIVGVHHPSFDADGAIQVYVDGVLEGTSSKSQTEVIDYVSFDPAIAIGLGFDGGGGYNDFDGLIDEVGIFDHAFDLADAQDAFNNTMLPEPASAALVVLGGLLLARRRS